MAELKTKARKGGVAAFLKSVDAERRKDCETLVTLMKQATRSDAVMWGSSIIGFGSYRYVYDSGRENDWFMAGFSPRKSDLTLYLMGGLERHEKSLAKLGKHKTGKSCLYIRKLEDVDVAVLKGMLKDTVTHLTKKK